ncbi:hypothetical protein QBC38DRAFT_448470 [Podospora fimiseda]|uniref:2EXR domain-containing protein n=1 Tax=Podospora fimiseda TaxID=252190 RepID=A0AAN6YT63_9PEZI|nr:hypothetical protein QBC38DRAFT_448470 [Podospora fimiseda]
MLEPLTFTPLCCLVCLLGSWMVAVAYIVYAPLATSSRVIGPFHHSIFQKVSLFFEVSHIKTARYRCFGRPPPNNNFQSQLCPFNAIRRRFIMEAAQVDDYEPEFKYFPKLPLEIRTLIWELYQLSFIHVVYPHELVGLAWTLLSGGARKTVPGSHSPPGKYPSSFPFHRSIAAREPRFIHWKRRFDARLLACYESSQIAKRQLAAEEALGHRPSNYPYHFGSFDVDLIYFARSRGWSRYQSMKGKPQNASILFSFGSTFKYCPITRIAIRTSPAALDSLDIKPEDMTVHSNGKEATGDDISAKERLAAVFKEWKSARSLWIVVDLPVAPSWLDPSVPEQKKTRKKKNKINHTRRLRARLAVVHRAW